MRRTAALAVAACLLSGEAMAFPLDTAPITKAIKEGQPPVAEPPLAVAPGDPLPGLSARSAIVLDAATGLVLYERNADERRYPASTTKIMTLILALEKGDLDHMVTISQAAEGVEGSTLWLKAGERIPLRELLYGMMMHSGNDATVAIAEHIYGSVPAFARQMTERARELGARDTSFVNANGLPDDDHYTTARDLAFIAAYGYSLPEFEDIVSTREKSYSWVHDENKQLRNENQMLWFYPGGNGVKTGYTDKAGRCLVSGAKHDGIQLVAVVLDSLFMWNDSIALLDYGFEQIEPVTVLKEGETVGSVEIDGGSLSEIKAKAASDVTLPHLKKTAGLPDFEKVLELPESLDAPVQEGDRIGRLVIKQDGREVTSVDLLAASSATKMSLWDKFLALWHDLWKGLFG